MIPRTFEFFKPSSTPPSSLLRVPHTARGGKKVRIPSRIPPSSFFVSRIVVNTRPPRRSTARCVFFLPPFFHGAHRIFACFQFLARLRLATTTTSSHKRQTYWKTRLGSGFTSELSFFWFPSKGEPRSLAKFLARIFVSVLTRHHRMAVSHETNSIFSE